jgi:hypothetical protein
MPPRSSYNLPPPWDPGYNDPTNVDAEGLIRSTFTTEQRPRGSYDQPSVPTGGYTVPKYVMDEGYGQGTFVTKQMDRGQAVILPPHWLDMPTTTVQSIGKVRGGGKKFALDVLSGAEDLPEPGGPNDPIQRYGQLAAKAVMTRVRAAPPRHRKAALKAVMDAVDPTLWQRVANRSDVYLQAGQSDPAALEQAMASSFSEGFLKEIVATGKKGQAPEPTSLMGLGCYGCTALVLADISESLGDTPSANVAGAGADGSETIVVGPFTFPSDTASHSIHFTNMDAWDNDWQRWFWEELRHLTVDAIAQSTGKDAAAKVTVEQAKQLPSPLPPAVGMAEIQQRVRTHYGWPGEVGQSFSSPWGDYKLKSSNDFQLDKWISLFNTPVYERFLNGEKPLAKTVHPKTGKDWGLYLKVWPTFLEFIFQEIPPPKKSWLGRLWDKIKSIPSSIKKLAVEAYHAAVEAVKDLGDIACGILNAPGADLAAGAGAAALGAPPQAGIAGAQIGKGLCASPTPPVVAPPPPPPPKGVSSWMAVLIVGGAVGAAYYLTKDKHRSRS